MALRIAGITIPNEKRVEVALTYLYGVGIAKSAEALMSTKINPNTKVKDLKEEEISRLRTYIEKNIRVEGELKREVISNIKRLKEIKAYRGIRHMRGLPARGQRTKTNSRTVRGNKRVTMGSGRRPAAQKT